MKDNYTISKNDNNSEAGNGIIRALLIIIGLLIVPLVVFFLIRNYYYILDNAKTYISYIIGIIIGTDFMYAIFPFTDDFEITGSVKKRWLVFVILILISLYFVMFFNINIGIIFEYSVCTVLVLLLPFAGICAYKEGTCE